MTDVVRECYAKDCAGTGKPKWSGGTCYIECDVCGREACVAWSEQGAWDEWDRNRHDDKVRDTISAYFADVPVSERMVEAGVMASCSAWDAEQVRRWLPVIVKAVCNQHVEELSNGADDEMELARMLAVWRAFKQAFWSGFMGRNLGEPQ